MKIKKKKRKLKMNWKARWKVTVNGKEPKSNEKLARKKLKMSWTTIIKVCKNWKGTGRKVTKNYRELEGH